MHQKTPLALLFLAIVFGMGCSEKRTSLKEDGNNTALDYAKGFSLHKRTDGTTILKVTSPWPNAKDSLVYALVPKEHLADYTGAENDFTAIIGIPVHRVVATSTTHIPALESLGVLPTLVGFPGTDYISSKSARERIENGLIKDLGQNEKLNTEYTLNWHPMLSLVSVWDPITMRTTCSKTWGYQPYSMGNGQNRTPWARRNG